MIVPFMQGAPSSSALLGRHTEFEYCTDVRRNRTARGEVL